MKKIFLAVSALALLTVPAAALAVERTWTGKLCSLGCFQEGTTSQGAGMRGQQPMGTERDPGMQSDRHQPGSAGTYGSSGTGTTGQRAGTTKRGAMKHEIGVENAEFVLLDRGRIYKVEARDVAELHQHAGQQVRLVGELDQSGRTIRVARIQLAGQAEQGMSGSIADRGVGEDRGTAAQRGTTAERGTSERGAGQERTLTGRVCRLACMQDAAGAGRPSSGVGSSQQVPDVSQGELVLIDRNRVYTVQSQDSSQLEQHIGHRVRVRAEVEQDGRTITRITSVDMLGAGDRGSAKERGTAAETDDYRN